MPITRSKRALEEKEENERCVKRYKRDLEVKEEAERCEKLAKQENNTNSLLLTLPIVVLRFLAAFLPMGELFVLRTSICSGAKWKRMTNPTMEKFKSLTSKRLVTCARMLEGIAKLNCPMCMSRGPDNHSLYLYLKHFINNFVGVFGVHWRIGFLSAYDDSLYYDNPLEVGLVLWRADPVRMPRAPLLIRFYAEHFWDKGFARIFEIETIDGLVPLEISPQDRCAGEYPLAHYIVPRLAHMGLF